MRSVARFASPDDPGGLVGEALSMGEGFPGPAEDLLTAWVLQLDETIDPATAAARLLERHAALPQPPGSAAARLLDLLREVAARPPLLARRRGGRRGRRPV